MDIFYNKKGVGDVLLVPIKQGDRLNFNQESFGDIVKITDQKDGSLLGYNVFNASSHLDITEHGKFHMSEAMVSRLKELFTENNLNDPLDFDLSAKFVVGYVKEISPHENADKLSVCQVDVGDGTLQIVCGAPNIAQDQKVVVAKVGATMPGGMKIKDAKLRGVPSSGMICSAKELDMQDAPKEKGILVLDDSYETGQSFEI